MDNLILFSLNMTTKLLLLLMALPFLFCPACGGKVSIPVPPPTQSQAASLPALQQQAIQAWQTKKYKESLRLYTLLADNPAVAESQQGVIWKRITLSALHTRDTNRAVQALATWAEKEPGARLQWEWNHVRATIILEQQGPEKFEDFLAALLQNGDLPWSTKKNAADRLLRHYLAENNLPEVLHTYHALYPLAPDAGEKKVLETDLQKIVQSFPLENLASAVDDTTLGSLQTFPKNLLVAVYNLKRMDIDETSWPQVWQDLSDLQEHSEWADTFPFTLELAELTNRLGRPKRHIALLIPLQGPYQSVGWRIARGVGAAQQLLNSKGLELEISIIDSAAPGWEKELHALPQSCRRIGGPLQRSVWENLLADDQISQRSFFTFMPSIMDEGTKAWRFFGSPRDQVRTVVKAALANDISRFAIFYPREPYGTKMAQYFWEEATLQGGEITGFLDYTPAKPTQWGKKVAKLLDAQNQDKGEFNPEPDFNAVFLPDSLDNAQLIVPQFFFYNENRMLFLGPQLWGQGDRKAHPLEAQYFDLSVFPGGWWDENPHPSVTELKKILNDNGQKAPDFWVALGFDFARFTARLDCLGTTQPHCNLNTLLSTSQPFDWTMAPISWNQQGEASQDYFLFQPTRKDFQVADQEKIAQKIAVRETRRQNRLEALNSTVEANTPLDITSPQTAGTSSPPATDNIFPVRQSAIDQ